MDEWWQRIFSDVISYQCHNFIAAAPPNAVFDVVFWYMIKPTTLVWSTIHLIISVRFIRVQYTLYIKNYIPNTLAPLLCFVLFATGAFRL